MKVTFYSERPYCFVVDSDSDIMPELVTHLDGLAVAGATMEFLKVISHTLNFTVNRHWKSLESTTQKKWEGTVNPGTALLTRNIVYCNYIGKTILQQRP